MESKLLPLAAMEKIMRESGAERVSDKAKSELKTVLESIAGEIGVKAVRLAEHAGRKTVKAEDIRLAAKNNY